MIFRELNNQEVIEFEQWARENDPPDLTKWDIYHPICRAIWLERGIQPKREEK